MKGSLRQRSPGSWELTVDLGRDAYGKRRRKHLTVRGSKAHAQRELRKLLTTLDRGIDIPTQKITLRDWLDRWLREVIAPNRRQGTLDRYGHVELAKLSPSHVQGMESRLIKRGMSPATVGLIHRILSSAVKHAMRMERIHRDPVALVRPPSARCREVVTPDMRAVRDVLNLAREDDHPLHAAIHLIAFTGLRRGEALGLTWDNVDLMNGQLRVVQSLVKSPQRGLMLQPPKTATGRRVIDLGESAVEVLIDHRRRQDEHRAAMRESYDDRGRVFAGPSGEWIVPEQLSKAVKSLVARVGYPRMTVHSLRHFHASVMLQTGQNIVVVSKRLGHSNVSITSDIYAHALPGWHRQAAAFEQAMEKGVM